MGSFVEEQASEEQVSVRFTGQDHLRPFFLPDLAVWFDWHKREKTLPSPFQQEASLEVVCRGLGVPCWKVVRPWTPVTQRVDIRYEFAPGEKTVTYDTPSGTLRARWTLGPDGDLWQAEYPVKGPEDLKAVLDIATYRSYEIPASGNGSVGKRKIGQHQPSRSDEVVALDLPLRPLSMLIYEFLGLSDGLMLLWDEPALVGKILSAFEESLQALVPTFLKVPGTFVVSPDNLDSQFISPDNFRNHFLESYSRTAEALHSAGKKLIVHCGGPVGSLLEDLGRSGVDGIEGIAGPPQGDTPLSEAREKAGPDLTLWGGIPQDLLLETHGQDEFEAAVRDACSEAARRPRMILGVADRVPPQASPERLKAIPRLIEDFLQNT